MLKKIKSEEFEQLPLHGKGRSSPAYNAILSMKVGDAIIIEKQGWKRKDAPTTLVNKIERKFGMKFIRGALADRSGWAVKRVK